MTWRVYLKERPNFFNAFFYYLAQIAYEIRKLNYDLREMKAEPPLRIETFLIPFGPAKKEKPAGPAQRRAGVVAPQKASEMTDGQKAAYLANSKRAWGALARRSRELTKEDQRKKAIKRGQDVRDS